MATKRSYILTKEAFYAESAPKEEEVYIQVKKEDGTDCGGFAIVWHWIGACYSPRVEAFDDAWSAVALCADALKKLAIAPGSKQLVTVDQVVALLDELGFEDVTEREAN